MDLGGLLLHLSVVSRWRLVLSINTVMFSSFFSRFFCLFLRGLTSRGLIFVPSFFPILFWSLCGILRFSIALFRYISVCSKFHAFFFYVFFSAFLCALRVLRTISSDKNYVGVVFHVQYLEFFPYGEFFKRAQYAHMYTLCAHARVHQSIVSWRI